MFADRRTRKRGGQYGIMGLMAKVGNFDVDMQPVGGILHKPAVGSSGDFAGEFRFDH